MTPLHSWAGIIIGWILYVVFITGAASCFTVEVDRWMRPERPLASADKTSAEFLQIGLARLRQQAPGAERWVVVGPSSRDPSGLRVFWRDRPANGEAPIQTRSELLDQAGNPVADRKTAGGQLLYRMHYQLHYLPAVAGRWIVAICTLAMLVATITGVIIHKRIFRDLFTLRFEKGRRTWLDFHNLFGVWTLPFQIMIAYSGLLFFVYVYMFPVVAASYGLGDAATTTYIGELRGRPAQAPVDTTKKTDAPLARAISESERSWGVGQIRYIEVTDPAGNPRITITRQRSTPLRTSSALLFDGVTGALLSSYDAPSSVPKIVNDTVLGLHEAQFAGPLLRWMYFFSGIICALMIAAGFVAWTEKRKARVVRGFPEPIGLEFVRRGNVGTFIGLPISIAIYFWSNRIIPVDVGERAIWETHTMFIVWAVMLLHPVFRSPRRAWTEQLWIAAAAYALLPVLNALTTDRHLGASLPQGDWVLAGFDLTMLAFGVGFACAAWMLTSRANTVVEGRESASLAAIRTAWRRHD